MNNATIADEYIIIPKSILTDTRLCKPNIKEFYGVILSLSCQSGYCFAGNAYLADYMACDVRSIKRWIKQLKDWGYIRVEYSKADSEHYAEQRKIYPAIEVVTDLSPTSDTNVPRGDTNVQRVVTDLSREGGHICHGGSDTFVTHNNINIKDKLKDKSINNKASFEAAINEYTNNPDLITAIHNFIDMRKSIKKPLTAYALKLIFGNLDKLVNNDADKIEVLNQSTMNCWQGVFELKNNTGGKTYGKTNGGNIDSPQSRPKYGNIF